MFESQHLQTIWFTGLAAHQERTAPALRPGGAYQAHGPEPRPSLLRMLAALAQRATRLVGQPPQAPKAPPDCCLGPICC